MSGWVWLVSKDGPHKVPDNPYVVEDFEAKGWVRTDIPGELAVDDPQFAELLGQLYADDEASEVEEAEAATTKKEDE